MLFIFIAVCMAFYFLALKGEGMPTLLLVLLFSVVGMGGSYAVAWYVIRINTYANARTAFACLAGNRWDVVNIPLRSGMSVGLFLISLELVMSCIFFPNDPLFPTDPLRAYTPSFWLVTVGSDRLLPPNPILAPNPILPPNPIRLFRFALQLDLVFSAAGVLDFDASTLYAIHAIGEDVDGE